MQTEERRAKYVSKAKTWWYGSVRKTVRGRYSAICGALPLLNSVGPGLWSGQSGKELVSAGPFLHPETERQATEVGRCGRGVGLEHRSIAWPHLPSPDHWLTCGPTQLLPVAKLPVT